MEKVTKVTFFTTCNASKNISGTARRRGKAPKCYHYFGTGHMEVDQFKTDTLNRKPFD